MKKIIYFLGYSKKKTSIINYLIKKKNIKLIHLYNKELTEESAIKADLIICFGYRRLIKKKILNLVNRPIINLHISYLPFNRGAHPNYWSFVDKTPKGVSIHEIDNKIDKGKLIYQKKVIFNNIKKHSFKSTYLILINEIEKLFKRKFNSILFKKYKSKKYKNQGTFHKKKNLPKSIRWENNIVSYLKKLN